MKFSFKRKEPPAAPAPPAVENAVAGDALPPPAAPTVAVAVAQANNAVAAVAATATDETPTASTTTTATKRTLFSLKPDVMRYRPRAEAGSAQEELQVALRIDAGVKELARRLVAKFFPLFPRCEALLAALREASAGCSSPAAVLAAWEALETQLQFGELRTVAAFVRAVRAVFEDRAVGVAPAVENAFEEALHRDVLPLLDAAVRGGLELKPLSDLDLYGLPDEGRQRVMHAVSAVDGEGAALFYRRASFAARRRVRALLREMKDEQEARQRAQQERQRREQQALLEAQRLRAAALEKGQQLRNAGQAQQAARAPAATLQATKSRPSGVTAQMVISDLRPRYGDAAGAGVHQQQQHLRRDDSVSLNPDLLFGPEHDDQPQYGRGAQQPQQHPQFVPVPFHPHHPQQQQQEQDEHRMRLIPHTTGNAFAFEMHSDDDGGEDLFMADEDDQR